MEEKDWFGAIRKGDKEVREAFIQKNIPLVWSIARRFLHREKDLQELFQIGCIGLIKAVDRFDAEREVAFSTYAVPFIMGELKRHFRDNGLLHVSRELKQEGWVLQKARENFYERTGKNPTIEELSHLTGYEREQIVVAMEANIQVGSIDEEVEMGDGTVGSLGACVTGKMGNVGHLPDGNSLDEEKEEVLNQIFLHGLLKQLEEVDRRLIILRYYKGKTQAEVAKNIGISQVQVSRKEKKILRKLCEWAKG